MLKDESPGELAKQQLLDDIRKRAEEAELARIEAEELKLALETTAMSSTGPDHSSPSDDLPYSEVTDLRDELVQALISNDLDRATALHSELAELLPDDPVMDQFGTEIAKLRERFERHKAPTADSSKEKQKAVELYAAANDAYQQEKYDVALQKIAALLTLDPENSAALDLRGDVTRAKDLAVRLAAEERKRKQEEEQRQQSPIPPAPPPRRTAEAPPPTPQVERKPSVSSQPKADEKSPREIRPNAQSIVRFLERNKWGVILTGVLLFLGIQTASIIYDQLRSTVFHKSVSMLVVPIPVQENQRSDDYLPFGLTDDFVSRLSQYKGIDVLGASTALRRHVTDFDGSQLAKALGAEVLLTLGIHSSPEYFTVRVALKEVNEGHALFEKDYPVQRGNLAVIPFEAIPLLVGALDIRTDEESSTRNTRIPEGGAFDAYLLARSLLRRPGPVAVDSAMKTLQIATLRDSLFADAHILLGWARILSFEESRDTSPAPLQLAHADLQRGMGLGAKASSAYTLWGMIEYYHGQHHEAIERLNKAVHAAPGDAEARRRLAIALQRVGRTEQAVNTARQAVESDPYNPASHSILGMLSLLRGNHETALREFHAESATGPGNQKAFSDMYMAALVANDRREQALDVAKKRANEEPTSVAALYDLGRMYQLAGKSKRLWDETLGAAKTLALQRLKEQPQNPRILSYLALIETRLGHFKEGMAASTHAVAMAPYDYEVLYCATRVLTLQRGHSPEAYALLAKAIYRRFSLPHILDLDLVALRRDPDFVKKITQ